MKFDRFAYYVVEFLILIGRWGPIILLAIILLAFFAGMHCDTVVTFP